MTDDGKLDGYDYSKRRRPDAVEWGAIAGVIVFAACYGLARWAGLL